MLKRIQRQKNKWKFEKMGMDLIFLEIAKRDLEASKLLFDRKLYSHAIFYAQQAIEKSTKSFGIRSKTITVSEAKNAIGHKAWRVYSKIFDGMKDKVTRFEKRLEAFPKLKEVDLIKEIEINRLKTGLKEYQKVFSDMTRDIPSSLEELQNIVDEINKLKDETGEEIIRGIEINEKEIESQREKIYQLLNAFSEINPSVVEEEKEKLKRVFTPKAINDSLKRLSKPISELIFCYSSLFYLSLIFSEHAIKSRYPEDDLNPLEVYNEKMPLVQMLDSFIKIAEETIEKLNHVYEEIPKNI